LAATVTVAAADEKALKQPRHPVLVVSDDPDAWRSKFVCYALAPPKPDGKGDVDLGIDVTSATVHEHLAGGLNAEDADPVIQMNRGVGLLEQNRARDALRVLEPLAARYSDWEAAQINWAIGLVHGGFGARQQCAGALERSIELNARSAPGLLYLAFVHGWHKDKEDTKAGEFLRRLVEVDPEDPHLVHFLARQCLEEGQIDEAVDLFEKAIRLQPSLASARYHLAKIHRQRKDVAAAACCIEEFKRLTGTRVATVVSLVGSYGTHGKHGMAIAGTAPPVYQATPWTPPAKPSFGKPVTISRFGSKHQRPFDGSLVPPAFAVADLDGDQSPELVLCGEARKSEGPPATSIFTRHKTGTYESLQSLPDAVVCAPGDIDSDGDPDLVLAGEGWLRAFKNDLGRLSGSDIGTEEKTHAGFPVRLCLADLDNDSDLDIVCLRLERLDHGKVRSRLEVLENTGGRNDYDRRTPVGRYRPASCGMGPFDFTASELIVSDLDGDIDTDILVIDHHNGSIHLFDNERGWRFRRKHGAVKARTPGAVSATLGDFDGAGGPDLFVFCGDSLHLLTSRGLLRFEEDTGFRTRFSSLGGTCGVVGDFLGAMRLSLLVLDARLEGVATRSPILISGAHAHAAIPLDLELGAEGALSAAVSLAGPEGPAELLIRSTVFGMKSYRIGTSGDWIGFTLRGSQVPSWETPAWSNLSGLGARLEVWSGRRRMMLQSDAAAGGTARSLPAFYMGLAGRRSVDLVRLRWSDAILQAEVDLQSGKVHHLREVQRFLHDTW